MQPKSHPWPGAVREQRGFTVIEVMVVVAILGLLAALAAPSFTPLIERWRVRQAAEDLRSSLTLARIEALRRGGGVVFRRTTPTTAICPDVTDSGEGSQWDCGWTTFVDGDNNNALGDGEAVITISTAPRAMTVTRGVNIPSIRLDRWGEANLGATGIGFVIKPRRAAATAVSAVCISSGGRIDIRPGDSEC